ncbi:MAG: hypothetical protein AB1513_08310 [Pseudomonadota bacterium]
MIAQNYVGFFNDENGGMTHLGQIVKDAWVFGLIPENEDCANWSSAQMQILYEKVYAEWERYGHLPSKLPDNLRERHVRIHTEAIQRARQLGWDPELGEDD